jgi:hypothetical protein
MQSKNFSLAEPRYEQARKALLDRFRTSHEMCSTFTHNLALQFPELSRVAGFYQDNEDGASREHWWLVTPTGEIVDPTADQFSDCGRGVYQRYDPELHLVVKGKCPCCGIGLYTRTGAYPCSEPCDAELAAEYGCQLSQGPYECDMEFTTDADITRKYGIVFPAVNA